MENFFKNRFYPQNFIMKKNGMTNSVIESLSHEAADLVPDFFDAETHCFPFVLRYQPPYNTLTELRRLQTEAIKHIRFKDEYHGFIAVDISEWQNHFNEEFFTAILAFLNEMSEDWKYIFLTDNENGLEEALAAFKKNMPSIRIRNIDINALHVDNFAEKLTNELSDAHKKRLTPAARQLLQTVFKSKVCKQDKVITETAKDIATYFYNESTITFSLLTEYLTDEFTYLCSYMTEDEKKILSSCIAERGKKR